MSTAPARRRTSTAASPDQGAGRGDHLRLRQGEAAGTPGQAVRRRRGHPGRRRQRGRGEGAQGPRRRRPARHPRGRRGRHRAGRRRRALARQEGDQSGLTSDNRRRRTRASRSCSGLSRRRSADRQNSGVDGSIVVGKVLENKSNTLRLRRPNRGVQGPRCRPASSTRPRSSASPCRMPPQSPASSSRPRPWWRSRRKDAAHPPCRAAAEWAAWTSNLRLLRRESNGALPGPVTFSNCTPNQRACAAEPAGGGEATA